MPIQMMKHLHQESLSEYARVYSDVDKGNNSFIQIKNNQIIKRFFVQISYHSMDTLSNQLEYQVHSQDISYIPSYTLPQYSVHNNYSFKKPTIIEKLCVFSLVSDY